jgi:oligopeptide/dipeptide ABC transporter ATP-binding protein
VIKIGTQIAETAEQHFRLSRQAARQKAVELLELVGIPSAARRINAYPHQFSGGMCQRVMIAMGMCCDPRILIADEPTTALDVTTQAQMLELMKKLVDERGASLVVVTHNLGVVARYADRIYVMYAGRVVESGRSKQVFGRPSHPYTIGLLKSIPRLDAQHGSRLVPIEGMPPDLIDSPSVCAFLPRCPYAIERCRREAWPQLSEVESGHQIRCYVNVEERDLEPVLA